MPLWRVLECVEKRLSRFQRAVSKYNRLCAFKAAKFYSTYPTSRVRTHINRHHHTLHTYLYHVHSSTLRELPTDCLRPRQLGRLRTTHPPLPLLIHRRLQQRIPMQLLRQPLQRFIRWQLCNRRSSHVGTGTHRVRVRRRPGMMPLPPPPPPPQHARRNTGSNDKQKASNSRANANASFSTGAQRGRFCSGGCACGGISGDGGRIGGGCG